ncbi:arginase/N-omega-hydroxy-L-arginine amidinohydrolase [Knoellia remsis]|uniref:Arginase/N-omega-hydroxy-L-arginine amidinohydrolase n=1 Tax=Knoellia remsis TaxID=407159 RepID=A0A2T0U888_9MICO|nr:arginase family protein [Knoellia remsis]PRY54141.1 arginase/N-omega-hydroxy-L-arginine amidinohydrolase [Knoellia remsis]
MSASDILCYVGPAGDHNDRAMAASPELARAFAEATGRGVRTVGTPVPAEPTAWDVELDRARADLTTMARAAHEVLATGQQLVAANTRCVVALATIPAVLRHRPETVVVWFDAHADIHVPDSTPTGFLGGMAYSGPLGWWDSGLGAGLPDSQAVLVGARDVDPAEVTRLEQGSPAWVASGPGLAQRLAETVGDRPVFVHIDCDVLEPGIVATDYRVADGLTLDDVAACASALSGLDVVGLEIGEFEGPAAHTADDLIRAVSPLLR